MDARTTLLAVMAVAVTGAACQPAGLSEADVAAIKSIGPAVDQAILAGDWDAVVAVMTEDGVWMPPNSPAVQGRAALKAWAEAFDFTMTEHELEFLEVDGYGDVAYARGSYAETLTLSGATEPIEHVGKNLAVLHKQPDGSWLIAVWIWNSDLPLPAEGSET